MTFVEDTLSDQLRGIYTPKLRNVEITGKHLRNIDQNAFLGLEECRQLLIQIHNTHVEELPIGLFAVLSSVVHLSIDLQNNRLASLSPSTFYSNATAWESVGTKLIEGGLLLKNNPWHCDCGLVWVGHWLRRWLRESLQIHTVPLEAAQHIVAASREASCTDPRTNQQTPLLDLFPEDLSCHASALSTGASALWCNKVSECLLRTLLVVVYTVCRFSW